MNEASHPPDNLEERFCEPEGWRWGTLKHKDRKIRYGVSFPKDTTPDAIVICLPGLSEFGEKYFELARDLNVRNMAFWIIDWRGQGKSTRYFENEPHKRHSLSFQDDIDDLHALYLDYIKHSSVHPDVGRIPRAMLAHSMGGNIGLRYIQQHPDTFDCALFTAPMFGLKAFQSMPNILSLIVTKALCLFFGENYASGQTNWEEKYRLSPGEDSFSSDPQRGALHNLWSLSDPSLQIGGITWKWLYEAIKSCTTLQNSRRLKSIQTHCTMITAGREELVNNNVTRKIVKQMPHAKYIEIAGARHELLMEQNKIREQVLESFQILVKECIIDNPEALKTF